MTTHQDENTSVQRRISVVIPAFNEEQLIGETLRRIQLSLEAFTRKNWQTEIIVCDNGSTDDSPAVARRFGAEVLQVEQARVAALRNQGASHARADVLAFIDADNEIAAGWVHAALECLQLPKAAVVGALVGLLLGALAAILADPWLRRRSTAAA